MPRPFPVPIPIPIPIPLPDIPCPPCPKPPKCEPIPDMYYWEAAPLTSSWLVIYEGKPPLGGVDIGLPVELVTMKIRFNPAEAIADSKLRNYKRKGSGDPDKFTFVNVARVYPLVGGIPQAGIEITCPETVISFDWVNRLDSKGVRIMPKGLNSTIKVEISERRWVQKKFDKI